MNNKTCNEWLKEMQAAGFTGAFRATNGEQVIHGSLTADGVKVTRKVKPAAQSREEIKAIFNARLTNG